MTLFQPFYSKLCSVLTHKKPVKCPFQRNNNLVMDISSINDGDYYIPIDMINIANTDDIIDTNDETLTLNNAPFSNKWINYFMGIATTVARQSKDKSTKVGAIVVNKHKHILATGFNGFPVGISDDDRLNNRASKLLNIVHAEANTICQAAFSGHALAGGIIFVTLPPCIECVKLIIQSGITCVIFKHIGEEKNSSSPVPNDWKHSYEQGLALLKEAGVTTICIY